MTTGDLIKRFIELRDKVALIEAAHELELKPYKDGMKAIENQVTADILAAGGDSIKVRDVGTAYREQTLSVTMADRETFMDFIAEDFERRKAFLTAAVTKDEVKNYLEEHQAKPPGLNIAYIWKTKFRRD